MELLEIINNIYPMPESSAQRLIDVAHEAVFMKNEVLISAGRINGCLYLIKRGLVRAYMIINGREITFWFGEDGSIAVSMESYINHRPGYETIATIEPTEIYQIDFSDLYRLYADDINIANWGRKFAEQEILRAEKCFLPQLFTTAAQRYDDFMQQYPSLLNRVPLEYIASYLGITPVSLSRIRASYK